MKIFTRVGAVISFLFCFLAGISILQPAFESQNKDSFMLVAIGLFLVGLAVFFGLMLWLTGEKCFSKQ